MGTPEKTIITIAGNMGVGKTVLTDLLSEHQGWPAFHELQDENPYLEDFYENMDRWAFHSQLFFLSRRMKLYQEMMKHEAPIIIQDRGIFEDAEIFEKNLHDQGHISDRDHKLYMDVYKEAFDLMPLSGFVVYLKASVSTLMQRIASRGRVYEKDISEQYVNQLNDLYDHWIQNFKQYPALVIEYDYLDVVSSRKDQKVVEGKIIKALHAWEQQKLTFSS